MNDFANGSGAAGEARRDRASPARRYVREKVAGAEIVRAFRNWDLGDVHVTPSLEESEIIRQVHPELAGRCTALEPKTNPIGVCH